MARSKRSESSETCQSSNKKRSSAQQSVRLSTWSNIYDHHSRSQKTSSLAGLIRAGNISRPSMARERCRCRTQGPTIAASIRSGGPLNQCGQEDHNLDQAAEGSQYLNIPLTARLTVEWPLGHSLSQVRGRLSK